MIITLKYGQVKTLYLCFFTKSQIYKIQKEIEKEQNTENAKKIILEHREDVELIAEALLEHETLNGEEIDYLLKNRKIKL